MATTNRRGIEREGGDRPRAPERVIAQAYRTMYARTCAVACGAAGRFGFGESSWPPPPPPVSCGTVASHGIERAKHTPTGLLQTACVDVCWWWTRTHWSAGRLRDGGRPPPLTPHSPRDLPPSPPRCSRPSEGSGNGALLSRRSRGSPPSVFLKSPQSCLGRKALLWGTCDRPTAVPTPPPAQLLLACDGNVVSGAEAPPPTP